MLFSAHLFSGRAHGVKIICVGVNQTSAWGMGKEDSLAALKAEGFGMNLNYGPKLCMLIIKYVSTAMIGMIPYNAVILRSYLPLLK